MGHPQKPATFFHRVIHNGLNMHPWAPTSDSSAIASVRHRDEPACPDQNYRETYGY